MGTYGIIHERASLTRPMPIRLSRNRGLAPLYATAQSDLTFPTLSGHSISLSAIPQWIENGPNGVRQMNAPWHRKGPRA
jgi:hypothetical protein